MDGKTDDTILSPTRWRHKSVCITPGQTRDLSTIKYVKSRPGGKRMPQNLKAMETFNVTFLTPPQIQTPWPHSFHSQKPQKFPTSKLIAILNTSIIIFTLKSLLYNLKDYMKPCTQCQLSLLFIKFKLSLLLVIYNTRESENTDSQQITRSWGHKIMVINHLSLLYLNNWHGYST